MSEFKYACPVCGQHIKCDSTQAGTMMECPTCFQKIVVPQAPASEDQKFILHGTKVGTERPVPAAVANAEPLPPPAPGKSSRTPAILLAVVVLAAAVLAVGLYGKFIKSGGESAPKPGVSAAPDRPAASARPTVAAPPANGALWSLSLETVTIPDTPAAGRIHGQDFMIERASFQNGSLALRRGTRGPVDFGIIINFSGAMAEALAGRTVTITTNTEAAARVTLRWSSDANSARASFSAGYAMRLEFGPLENGRLPGKIYLCTPDDDQSYLLGTFSAEVRKPKPPKPQ